DSHLPELIEALAHPALDDVLQVYDPERATIVGDDQRRAALLRDALDYLAQTRGRERALLPDVALKCVNRPLSYLAPVEVNARHARLRGEGDEVRLVRSE